MYLLESVHRRCRFNTGRLYLSPLTFVLACDTTSKMTARQAEGSVVMMVSGSTFCSGQPGSSLETWSRILYFFQSLQWHIGWASACLLRQKHSLVYFLAWDLCSACLPRLNSFLVVPGDRFLGNVLLRPWKICATGKKKNKLLLDC